MELGMGFLIGVLAGAVVSVIAGVIIMASRRAIKAEAVATDDRSPAPEPVVAPRRDGATTTRTPRRTGNTMIVENVEERDAELQKNIQSVRELLLRLATVISTAGDASGQAAIAFNTAKQAIDALDLSKSEDLADAQHVLVDEIDRVLHTNAALHSELERANQGIAEQRKQIEELRVQARIDGLTRIPNRAAFDERLREYLALLDRTDLQFSLLLLDIDHFKEINDSFGHVNGDRILRGVAAKISDSIRANDFAARYGGEEFAVIMPGTELDAAAAVSERVRHDIAKTNFRLDSQNIRMTVSGGLAQCKKGMDPDDFVAIADQALYHAKSKGRNRISMEK